jgi:hypothetical protein
VEIAKSRVHPVPPPGRDVVALGRMIKQGWLQTRSFFQAGMGVSEMMERLGVVIWQLVTLLDFETKYAFFNPEVSILALE